MILATSTPRRPTPNVPSVSQPQQTKAQCLRPQSTIPAKRAPHALAALLVGFKKSDAETGSAILRAAGWDRVLIDGGNAASQIIRSEPIEMVVIDVDHCEDYAPRLITEIRQDMDTNPEIQTRIIALALILPEGLSHQLHDAGADRVLTKRGARQSAGTWLASLP